MIHRTKTNGQRATSPVDQDIPLENAYEESRRQNILQNKIIAAKLGILWNGTKSPHPKSLPRFFTRVMCRQKDDSVGQLLKKQLATAHVPNKDSERTSDADIGRKEAGFGPIVLASNHLRGHLGSAHLDPPELNIKELPRWLRRGNHGHHRRPVKDGAGEGGLPRGYAWACWKEGTEANPMVAAPLPNGHRNLAGDDEIWRQMVVDGDKRYGPVLGCDFELGIGLLGGLHGQVSQLC
ncbi:uncharacterized protein [Lolium perenne]|uniref:uncharacterized protein n=1 Tax=Lolium perenne TaxID=4522 RepID=UPI003A997158